MPFSDVVGHARSLGLLSRSIARGTLPPSLLFSGPEGVGKRLVATALAQALNCTSPRGGAVTREERPRDGAVTLGALPRDGCGTCPACRRIARGAHADVLTVAATEGAAIKVDQVRDVIAAAAYRPFEGRVRVVIVDDAERLNPEAQNALLKSLEEPPAGSVFVLVSSRPETLLPTVRSRCSRLRFGSLSAAEVARFLVNRKVCEPAEAHAIAAVADGSPGRALQSASRAVREARAAALTTLQAVANAPSARERLLAAGGLLAGRKTSAQEREEMGSRLRMLSSLLRDVALLSNGGPAGDLANSDVSDEIAVLVEPFGGERAQRGFAVVDRAIAALARNANPKIVADWVVVRLW